MTTETAEFDVGDICCYRDAADPNTFYCIPGAPTAELDPTGHATVSLWLLPQQARLQLGARWTLTPADTDAVRAAISARFPSRSDVAPNVATAPVQVDSAVVLLEETDGTHAELATSKSSGFPPYSAVFTAVLDEGHAALISSAFNGARGRLFVEYRAHLDRSTPIALSLTGDLSAEIGSVAGELTRDDARQLLERGLTAGHLTLSRRGPQDVPDDVWRPLEEQALAAAAQDLQQATANLPQGPANSTAAAIHRELGGQYRVSSPVTRRADIADWFADGSGSEHIRVLGVPQGGTR